MHPGQALRQLLVGELLLEGVLADQRQPARRSTRRRRARIAQGPEAGDEALLEALADLGARAAQVAQGIEPEIVVPGFAALEQVVVHPPERGVQRRPEPFQRQLLQPVEQRRRVLPALAERIVGGID